MHWRDLEVWKKSHELVLKVYEATKTYPKSETYALKDQIRRASSSVPANIVEGQSRNTTIDKDISESLGCDSETLSKMLNGLIKSLSSKAKTLKD
jgi:hypothetical protein